MNALFFLAESEPENLKEEKRLVLNSTQKLAFNNYQAFIGTAECTREVFKEVRLGRGAGKEQGKVLTA